MLILPSSYAWFLLPPNADLKMIDNLAIKGQFPTLQDLYPSIVFAILLGITRIVLTPLVFKVCIRFNYKLITLHRSLILLFYCISFLNDYNVFFKLYQPLAMYARGIPPLTWKPDPSIEDHLPIMKAKARGYLSVCM